MAWSTRTGCSNHAVVATILPGRQNCASPLTLGVKKELSKMDSISLLICQVDRSRIPMSTMPPDQLPGQQMLAVVTWIPEECALRIGLPRGSICGVLRDSAKPIEAENFVTNRDFVDILHYLNANHLDPDLVAYASQSAERSIAIIDQRSPDVNAAVPAEDILGVYEVENRKIVKYQPNPNYRLVTIRGVFKLTPWLRKCLDSAVLSEKR